MPFYLKEVDVLPEVSKFKSVLIVPCRFCPAASMATRKKKPYIEFFSRLLETKCYEDCISGMQSQLEQEGIKTSVFRSNILNFIICMWTPKQRRRFIAEASKHEAVVVLGCEAIYNSIRETLQSTDCQVFHGMESEGVFDVTLRFKWPFNISLDLNRVTPVVYPKS